MQIYTEANKSPSKASEAVPVLPPFCLVGVQEEKKVDVGTEDAVALVVAWMS